MLRKQIYDLKITQVDQFLREVNERIEETKEVMVENEDIFEEQVHDCLNEQTDFAEKTDFL